MGEAVLLEVAKQAPALIVALAALWTLGGKLDRLADRVDRLADSLRPDRDDDGPSDRRGPGRRTGKAKTQTEATT